MHWRDGLPASEAARLGRPECPGARAVPPERWANSDFSMGAGYSLASATGARGIVTPPEICDAIRNAATTAGTLINLRN